MSAVNWAEIYDDYADAELAKEIAELKKRVSAGAGSYTGQSVGGKSYTKDPATLQAMLQGAIRVKTKRSRGTGPGDFRGVADMSGGVDGSIQGDPR